MIYQEKKKYFLSSHINTKKYLNRICRILQDLIFSMYEVVVTVSFDILIFVDFIDGNTYLNWRYSEWSLCVVM